MARFRFWMRWSWRDLRRRWLQVVATALVIAIGTGLYAGLGGTREWRERSNDLSFAQLAYHDLRVDLSEGSFVRAGALERALRELREQGVVRVAEERLIVPTQVDASRPGRTVLVPGQIVGIPSRAAGAGVDELRASAGRTLTAADARRDVVVLDLAFARHFGLPDSGTVRIPRLGRVRYVGQGLSPQFFLVSGPGFFGGEATFAVMYAPLRAAQRAAGRAGRVNEVLIRLAPGADVRRGEREVQAALARALPGVGTTVTRGTEERAYRILYDDARSDQRLLNVFAYLVLGGAAFAAFNLISRVVESERREIGVGMALGVPPRALALRPLLMGAQIALLGTALGIAIGAGFATWLAGVFEQQLPLPTYATAFQSDVFAAGAALGFLLPLAATAYPVWRGVRVAPIEAITVGFRTAKGGGFAPLLKRIRLPGSSLVQMPLRNLARAPRRTITTVLGLAAVITTVVSLSGMFDSFRDTVGGIEAEALHQSPARLDVLLNGYHRSGGRVVDGVGQSAAVGAAETSLQVQGELRSGGQSIDAVVGFVDAGARIWRPRLEEGSFRRGSEGIVIARKAAQDLGLGVGDTVVLRHPVRRGPATFGLADTRVPVTGVHPNPLRVFAYMDRTRADLLGLRGWANAVSVTPAPGVSQTAVQRSLFGRPGVASVQPVAAETREVEQAVDEFTEVITVTETVTLLLALLMAFNSTSIAIDERRREFATLFAFGVPVRTGLRVAMVESVITGVLATLVGIAAGVAVVNWTMKDLLADTLPDLGAIVTLAPASIATAVAVGIGAVALAPLLTVRRLRRMDIPATLRVIE
jgi:putative ABC transport system permease protein